MALSGITAAASNGMQMATHQLASAAANIAQGQLDPKDILDVRTAEDAFTANASVIRTADEMSGRLLDVLA